MSKIVTLILTEDEHRALSTLLAYVCQIEASKSPTSEIVQQHIRILQRIVEAKIGPSEPVLEMLRAVKPCEEP